MQTEGKKPEIIVFAGPNGSGKLSGYSRRERQSFFIGKMSSGTNLG